MWQSIQAIVALPDETRTFTGHDYQPGKREPAWESTVGEQKRWNSHLVGKDEDAYVHLREERDQTLPMPKLMLLALQVNIRGGQLPEPESNGIRYLKLPLDALEQAALTVHHAFWLPGAARGVEHNGRRIYRDRRKR